MMLFDKFMEWMTKSEDGQKRPMKIQSLIFDKGAFTREKAIGWAKAHGYRSDVDETGSSFRLRQADPSKYDTMRTIDITSGVKAVVGKSKLQKSSPSSSQVHVPTAGTEERITIKSKSGHVIEIGKGSDEDSSEVEKVRKSNGRRVAKIAVKHGGKVLMGKRRDNGKWTFPGGHVEHHETMKEGAMRELQEETGITADPKILHPFSGVDHLDDRHGKPLHVQAWTIDFGNDEKPPTSMKQDPDAEVHKWQWIDVSKGLPDHIKSALHVPPERCNILHGLGLAQKGVGISKSDVVDADDDLSMYPGIDNLEGGLLKAAFDSSDDNEADEDGIDMQRMVEGTDWELEHTTKDESMAREAALEQLRIDPNHYRKLELYADGSDDVLTKDTEQTEEDPFAGEGFNLDLGSGNAREPGHIGLDLYPHDANTMIWDINMGIPFPDSSCKSVRMSNMDQEDMDQKAVLSEIHRVLMPGGQFHYEGPNEIYNYQEWNDALPGFVLVNHESYVGKYTQPENSVARQQFLRIATPDPATANDAEPRIGVSQLDQLPADQLLAADAMSYYYSDATSSGRGNRLHGYASQGALANETTQIQERSTKGMGSAGGGGWSNRLVSKKPMWKKVDKDQMASAGDDSNPIPQNIAEETHNALNPKNPNPLPPKRLARKSRKSASAVEKVLKSARIVPIIKADNERQIVYGVVLAPNEVDSQDDFMVPEEIEMAAHRYLLESRVVGSEHSKAIQAQPVESFIAPQDFDANGQYGPQPVKKGSWVLGVKVHDPDEWEKIKSGEYTGFSVGGFGLRRAV